MKTFFKYAGIASMLVLMATILNSCKKSTDDTVTDQEAAGIVSSAASSSSGGMGYDITNAITYTTQYAKNGHVNKIQTANCNTPESIPINWSSTYGSYSFSYTGVTNYELFCSAGNPTSFTVSDGYNGQYSLGTTLSASANDTSNWTITGLDSASTAYTFNGSFNQNGNYKETSGSKTFSYTFSITYNATNITVDKSSQEITGGSASVAITATVNGGHTYSATGSIVYGSNGTGTLTVGSYSTTFSY